MTDYNQRKEHFKDAMADILRRRVEFPLGAFVTVVDAKLTNDLRFANTVLSVMPISAKEGVVEALEEFRKDITKEMALKLGMRRIPKLHWSFDDSQDVGATMNDYINELKEKGELDYL
jgi:ribosome-binding factor A